jgi:hypothetical protein
MIVDISLDSRRAFSNLGLRPILQIQKDLPEATSEKQLAINGYYNCQITYTSCKKRG